MSEICKTCGLPSDLCVCSDMAMTTDQKIKVYLERRKWGKHVTIIAGLDKTLDLKGLTKKLKGKLATGGTSKDGQIVLQGSHTWDVKDFLVAQGFEEEQIEISS